MFHRAESLEPALEHRVVGGLASVAGDGVSLARPVDGDVDVELVVVAADERGGELLIELVGDVAGDRPRQHRHAQRHGGQPRRVGCVLVVRVAGHSPVVEHQQQIGVHLRSELHDQAGEFVDRRVGEFAVRVPE